ncbi:MAG: hypothetical protein A2Y28_03830 [Chlamydiae bacterium GWC2_50_10]|nr:MAG: hypothetical protein A2Z85_00270 [Chlamydiae bacterium GWA2_50_15]OGN54637.1 MAG: hypothetical protein A2098_03880 [Chlamydiae bacterium GWF2_49_8]OGN54881.1 MAG: hypothetical protein A2Y28_03830 [Chlamydiae bacterium GWC2_50_10]OGN57329.1 MAG: hypothetical protein A3D18_02825 [Chlamydiae bacterium RIFCSPHIGHO2_02_FULL_49_29]OGN62814.1 MAG: hypothetical protein A3E26_01600 [Chlamydiae bacterium RIFCSPHIGHO2_12_FULL_49_32]OGN68466.1 MAG: hypothetical protein A3I15_01185 [Chlamydiae bact
MNKIAFFFTLMTASAWAGSVNLVNDTAYSLRAVVRGGDGTYLGEMVIQPEHSMRWTDTYGQVGYFGKGSIYHERSTRSQTPYEVRWYCLDGGDFGISRTVSTGATSSASSSEGRRMCAIPKKKKGPYPNQPESYPLEREE